ncbi:MAG: hypothetical protein IT345_11730 [Trueperaceae bacterium]|nr:hypothetical protein [Trueperaceae bacterium]
MPEKVWDMTRSDAALLASEDLVLAGGTLRLRPRDPETGRYRPDGILAAGETLLPGAPAAGLRSVYGFRADQDEQGGRIRFRLSTDGGATFLWHDGPAWTAASGSGDWNTAEEIDRALPDLSPAPGRHLALAVRLEPSLDGRSPLLRRVAVYLEHEVDFWEDLARSVKRHLEAHVAIRSVWRGDVAGAAEIALDTDLAVAEPVDAFDLATDPGRTDDLFASLAGKTVRLARPVTGTVEVRFVGRPPVHIAPDVDYQLSEIPSVVLQIPRVTEVRKLRSGDRKLDWAIARGLVRERLQPVWLAAELVVSCQSEKKREALAMADALARSLEQERAVRSLATGEDYTVTVYGPSNAADQVAGGLAVIQTAVTLQGPAWLGAAEEKRLAEVIGFGVGRMDRRFDELEVR